MKIGEYDLDEKDSTNVNAIISDFLNFTCKVIDGIAIGAGFA